MNFFKFLLYSSFIILLFMRLRSGPYIYQSSKKHYIEIINHKFDTPKLTIKKGDSIIFVNKDQIRHTIVTNNNFIENSPILFQNDSWEVSLNTEAKQVNFQSSLYDNMNEVNIIIEEIFKDTTAQNKFRKNLLDLKTKGYELKNKLEKQINNRLKKK